MIESNHSPRFVFKHIGWSHKMPTHDQNQPKSLPTQTHGRQKYYSKLKQKMTENKEHQAVTKAICSKGFSGNSSVLPRSNFGVGGQESSPQSLTEYSLARYMQAIEKNVWDSN